MNSINSITSSSHSLVMNLTDKMDLKLGDALSNLTIFYTWKDIKKSNRNNKFKISWPFWDEEQMGSILYQIFEIILSISLLFHQEVLSWVYHFEFFTSETMKLLGSSEKRITKDKNDDNAPWLAFTKVVLIHCNLINNSYPNDSKVLHTSTHNKSFWSLINISPPTFTFFKTFRSNFLHTNAWFID